MSIFSFTTGKGKILVTNYALLIAGLFFGILTARADTIGARGGVKSTNLVLLIINTGSLIASVAIFIWGFMNFVWWVTLLVFFVLSFVIGFIVSRSNWFFFYQAIPVTGIITMSIAGAAWFL